ncbi:beta-xylosidase [Alkalihalobacillus alcalophilus ATCC 27647 = CGMCC 1.3604]|uniref:Beta-xylosidase n=1 Tax=Alkalihalobacillus alcalophilus ATCC 27647 = CGMCC 1.3604 TaxID=1218173 RepID=A0A094YVH8_ALKAL|nr:glycoside hydrolase family 43 protein [Alkalihalobacillus alcalophilus]KGA97522.1 beta-xylosidase [Alkalihalobacillus alcalophilus ATCC 27647 = CGMCC 1.3604]MED1560775.1 glycoside hydrolase family 43 protein [Alkalihalobacillus alcalophilus]THG92437.1 beta-xylosidase [Alkalihalobacillus alcalophilus ATCC 27647 = CGMCC 1.3604]
MSFIQNPILTGFNPDPSICRAGEDYYIAVSTFEWFPGVGIYHSKDLKNWRLVSRPLNRLSQLNMSGNPDSGGVWAPALSYSDGKFWLIYTDVKVTEGQWKDCHNYLVSCETIDGEWSEPVHLNSSGFDPSLFHNEDGKKYFVNMVWDHRLPNHSFYGIVLQEFDPEKQKLVGKKEIIFTGTDIKLTEAPHLYKIGDYYYLLTAEGGTKFEHQATIARSKNIWGPYEVHPENPLITSYTSPRNPLQKAGHASIVQTHTDEWFLVHLTGRPLPREGQALLLPRGYCPLGRETAIQRLEWQNDWPYVVGGNEPALEIQGPDIPETPWEQDSVKDDFDAEELSLHFQSLRIPLGENILSLKDNPGHLRLYGKESLTSKFTQAFAARRWQHFRFHAETKVKFNPESFQQAAGLVNYYNTQNWTALQITWHEEKGRILDLMTCDNFTFARPLLNREIVIPDEVEYVSLRVDVETDVYRYSYSFDGTNWTQIEIDFESYKLSDDYIQGGGFFTGAFVGMQCQDTSGANLHADFDYFSYEEKK